jgi:hypothetical protein
MRCLHIVLRSAMDEQPVLRTAAADVVRTIAALPLVLGLSTASGRRPVGHG